MGNEQQTARQFPQALEQSRGPLLEAQSTCPTVFGSLRARYVRCPDYSKASNIFSVLMQLELPGVQ
jgi:hypothetical protein